MGWELAGLSQEKRKHAGEEMDRKRVKQRWRHRWIVGEEKYKGAKEICRNVLFLIAAKIPHCEPVSVCMSLAQFHKMPVIKIPSENHYIYMSKCAVGIQNSARKKTVGVLILSFGVHLRHTTSHLFSRLVIFLFRSSYDSIKEELHLSAATRRCLPPPPAHHTYSLAVTQNTPNWQ